MCSFIAFINVNSIRHLDGEFATLGALGFASQVLLNVSIGRFKEKAAENHIVVGGNRSRSESEVERHVTMNFRLWNGKSVVSVLLSLSAFLLTVACDLLRRFPPANIILRIATMTFCGSAVITHVFKGKRELPGYKLYQPFEGGYTFMLLQVLTTMWLLHTHSCYCRY
jgi:hypothetical protein